jgi:hypothetical protein
MLALSSNLFRNPFPFLTIYEKTRLEAGTKRVSRSRHLAGSKR